MIHLSGERPTGEERVPHIITYPCAFDSPQMCEFHPSQAGVGIVATTLWLEEEHVAKLIAAAFFAENWNLSETVLFRPVNGDLVHSSLSRSSSSSLLTWRRMRLQIFADVERSDFCVMIEGKN